MSNSKVSEIQFVGEDGQVRGSVTDKTAIQTLVKDSDLLKLQRNEWANVVKPNEHGVLQIQIPSDIMNDDTLSDLVDFLNGEHIFKYNNAQEALFKNKILKYENYGSESDFGDTIYKALQYFQLPEDTIRELFEKRITFPGMGEFENNIEQAMNELRDYTQDKNYVNSINGEHRVLNAETRRQWNAVSEQLRSSPSYQFPPETMNMNNTKYEAWLRSGGIKTLRNFQDRFAREEMNGNNNGNNNENNNNNEARLNALNRGELPEEEALEEIYRLRARGVRRRQGGMRRGGKTRSVRKVRPQRKRRMTRRRIR